MPRLSKASPPKPGDTTTTTAKTTTTVTTASTTTATLKKTRKTKLNLEAPKQFAVALNLFEISFANEPKICSQKCTLQYISPLSFWRKAGTVARTPEDRKRDEDMAAEEERREEAEDGE